MILIKVCIDKDRSVYVDVCHRLPGKVLVWEGTRTEPGQHEIKGDVLYVIRYVVGVL
jgi:hypothetical protein